MSFSFTAGGSPTEVIAEVGRQTANPKFPPAFADTINAQLSGLPRDASVELAASGSTGWGEAQTSGTIHLSMSMNVRTANAPAAGIERPEQ